MGGRGTAAVLYERAVSLGQCARQRGIRVGLSAVTTSRQQRRFVKRWRAGSSWAAAHSERPELTTFRTRYKQGSSRGSSSRSRSAGRKAAGGLTSLRKKARRDFQISV